MTLSRTKLASIGLAILSVLFLVAGAYYVLHTLKPEPTEQTISEPTATTTVETRKVNRTTIGTSVEGRPIESYTYGKGAKRLLFVGGIHGGYEWNSVLLAYTFIDYLEAHPELYGDTLSISVIPSLNPDGVFEVIKKEGRFALTDVPATTPPSGTGRFNAHAVDLNRNFDCKWKPESTWRSKVVSAGTAPFSEPEAVALRDLVLAYTPASVVFWHSQSNAVYASECTRGILSETRAIMNVYAKAAGYPAIDTFDAYPVTGDAEGWLASIDVPAITVELKTHETIEWDKNLAGIKALIVHSSKEQ